MPDLFKTLYELNRKIENLKETEHLVAKYYDSFITIQYTSMIELKNIDFCLDYLSYPDFTKIVSENLKDNIHKIKQEMESKKIERQKLEKQREIIIDEIIKYSTFSIKELIEFLNIYSENSPQILNKIMFILSYQRKKGNTSNIVSFYIKKKHSIYMNNKLRKLMNSDQINFLKFCINLRAWNEFLSLKDAYLLYILEEKEKKETFNSCINR